MVQIMINVTEEEDIKLFFLKKKLKISRKAEFVEQLLSLELKKYTKDGVLLFQQTSFDKEQSEAYDLFTEEQHKKMDSISMKNHLKKKS